MNRSRTGPFDRRLLAHASSVRWVLGIDVGAGIAGTLLLLAQVTLVATVIAAAADGSERPIAWLTVAVLSVVILTRGLLAHVVERSGRRAATRVMSSLRTKLVAGRLHHGGSHHAPADSGALATAAVQGVDGLETYFARYLPQLVLAVLVPAAVLVWAAAVDVESAVIMLVTLPLIPVFMVLIGRSAESRSRANWLALATLSTHFLDVVRGLPTLRAFNRGKAQIPKIRETTEAYRRTTMSTLRLSFLSGFVLDLATTLSTALVAVTLGVRLVDGSLGLRPALIVLMLVPELYAPIRAVGTLFHASTDGLAAAERILDELDIDATAPPAGTAPHRILPDPAVVPLRLRNVTVRFPDRATPALDRVDLDVEPGELLALVGPSGAGKTTLGRVILGLQPRHSGTLAIGDHQIGDADLDTWRHALAWAPQTPALLHSTVAANIALGRPSAARHAVIDAAGHAGAHQFIGALPEGYETVIGGGGRGLSAGQRQRIGLARALLRDASLLILDEPTAHLDARAVLHVAETLDGMRGTRTIIVLTHDTRLVDIADRAVRVDAGRLTTAERMS